ncbi:hypothetical protein RV10_GL002899 [Enterococcus pallens]|nr:hypothetical protein RV10_GL002899 [Enterococcus pallens]
MWTKQDLQIAAAYLNAKNLELYFQIDDNRFERITSDR